MENEKREALVFSYNPRTGESNWDTFKDYHEAMKFYNSIQEDFPNRKRYIGTQVRGKLSTEMKIGDEIFKFGKDKE